MAFPQPLELRFHSRLESNQIVFRMCALEARVSLDYRQVIHKECLVVGHNAELAARRKRTIDQIEERGCNDPALAKSCLHMRVGKVDIDGLERVDCQQWVHQLEIATDKPDVR